MRGQTRLRRRDALLDGDSALVGAASRGHIAAASPRPMRVRVRPPARRTVTESRATRSDREGWPVPERPLTVDEVAELMRVSSKTVMRAIASGHLEASQVTQGRGGWRVRPQAIEAWLDSRSNRARPVRPLDNVRRVETQTPTPRRPGRAPRTSGSGTLVA